MEHKYTIAKVNLHNWQDDTFFIPNMDKSQALVDELNIDLNKPYCLVNKNFGLKSIDVKNIEGKYITCVKYNDGFYKEIDEPKLPIIEMKIMDGYSLFDWYLIIKNASCVYTVETSLCYIMELINGKYKSGKYENKLYTKWFPNEYGKGIVENIFTRVPWTFVNDDFKFKKIKEKYYATK